MHDILRNNWFVVVIGIVILSFVVYFVFDETKYNVSAAKDRDGNQVIASVKNEYVSADEVYDELSAFDASTIYAMYRNAVVNQSVETTDELEQEAKEMEDSINTNAASYYDDPEMTLAAQLANYGYSSYDELYDYCLMWAKQTHLQEEYITDNFDSITAALDEYKPRTVSIISMAVANPESLTEDEQEKKDNIDSALSSGSFADAATAYSEDTETAGNDGFYGYIDSNSTGLNSKIITAACELEKGATSDWIEVTDTNTGSTTLYKVHVDETDKKTIWDHKDETVREGMLNSLLTVDTDLAYVIVEHYAKDLDITFNDEKTQKKLESYINSILQEEEANED